MKNESRPWLPMPEFRNRLHQLRRIVRDHFTDQNLSLRLGVEKERHFSELETPGLKESLRFAELIQDFAHPNGKLFFPLLVSSFLDSVPLAPDAASKLREHSLQVRDACSPVVINGEKIAGPAIFQLVADGGLLTEKPPQLREMSSLDVLPFARDFLEFEFHNYCHNVFEVMCHIYELIRSLEREGVDVCPEVPVVADPCCIYCRTQSATFDAVEHIYPESLGNKELILPRGVVCDTCNHGILSGLDAYLVDCEPLNILRVSFVPWNPKTGRYLEARTQRFTLRRCGPRELQIVDHGLSKADHKAIAVGQVPWISRRPFDPIMLGRALYKIGLGLVAHFLGHEQALGRRYDSARTFVLGHSLFPSKLLVAAQATASPDVKSVLVTSRGGSVFDISIFGFRAWFNLEATPVFNPDLVPDHESILLFDLSDHEGK